MKLASARRAAVAAAAVVVAAAVMAAAAVVVAADGAAAVADATKLAPSAWRRWLDGQGLATLFNKGGLSWGRPFFSALPCRFAPVEIDTFLAACPSVSPIFA
jgi:hypothetical protein